LSTSAVSQQGSSTGAVSQQGTDWRRAVEPYVGPDARRASFQLITTLAALFAAMVTSYVLLSWSLPLALLLMFPIAGLLVRTFVLMHDCAHASFFASRRLNDTVGFVLGVLTFTPFEQWRRDHALHHASSGDLDRRGHGDVPTLTVREYLAKSRWGRLGYRIVRHPVLLLMGGPIWLAVGQRIRGRGTATHEKQARSVLYTNVALGTLIAVGLLTMGFKALAIVYLLPFYIAAMTGVWLFYVQHQFEDAYWAQHGEWDYLTAAIRGSSYLRLPRVLNWFTGDIGLHHVHHVAPRIPNFRLQQCHEDNAIFHESPVITVRSGMSALRLSLWDEENNRLISFRDLGAR
jgi:acyl-lipid omega-6 desaturase (Delta-12 desaturase)